MEIKLLSNNTGVIMTRATEVINSELAVSFIGAVANMTAVFALDGGTSVYRKLERGACKIPLSALVGEVSITVADMKKIPAVKWECEKINVRKLESGEFLVCPNDVNLRDAVALFKLELDAMRDEQTRLKQHYIELAKKLDTYMDGNNLI